MNHSFVHIAIKLPTVKPYKYVCVIRTNEMHIVGSYYANLSVSTVHIMSNIQVRICSCAKRRAANCVARIRFGISLCEAVYSGEVDPVLTYSTDEAWVYLIGHLNNRNYKYQSALNPGLQH